MTPARARRWALRAVITATVLALVTIGVHGEASGQAWAAICLVAAAAGWWLSMDSAVHADQRARQQMKAAAEREAEHGLMAQEVRW